MKVAILSDIHANIFALDAVLADCKDEEVGHFIVAGDLVGYYYWPKLVVQRLMQDTRVTCIRGNHEDILAETLASACAADCYRQKYGSGYDVCLDSLSDEELRWLLSLPSKAELAIDGVHFSVHHGSPSSTDEYIYPDANSDILARCHDSCHYTVLGHTHYPFMHASNSSILVNPGSVGQPRDCGGQASYVVINLANRSLRFKRIPYDIGPVIAAAKARDPALEYLQKIMTRRVG